jgi:hypothetical protein
MTPAQLLVYGFAPGAESRAGWSARSSDAGVARARS